MSQIEIESSQKSLGRKFQKVKGPLVHKCKKKISPRMSKFDFIKIKTLHIKTNKKLPQITPKGLILTRNKL